MQTHNNSLLAFKTKVLIIITHTHKQKTGGLALVCLRDSSKRHTDTSVQPYRCCHSNQGQVV